MYCIADSITQNEKKKIIQQNVVWSFYLYQCSNVLLPIIIASSLRNNSLFLNPHCELWNLSPTVDACHLVRSAINSITQNEDSKIDYYYVMICVIINLSIMVEIETSNNVLLNYFFLLVLSYGVWNAVHSITIP